MVPNVVRLNPDPCCPKIEDDPNVAGPPKAGVVLLNGEVPPKILDVDVVLADPNKLPPLKGGFCSVFEVLLKGF